MKSTIYKIVMNDDKCYYTDNRHNLVQVINEVNKNDDKFKPYNINTINGILYNKNKIIRGVKSVERFDAMDYYKEYIDEYTEQLIKKAEKQNKTYSPAVIKRFKQHFITLLNSIEFDGRNNGETDDAIKSKINAMGLIKV
tara:strand:+ start:184 stop:603 length:420 start_codon:yes stop_codon:yes gene_type:complete